MPTTPPNNCYSNWLLICLFAIPIFLSGCSSSRKTKATKPYVIIDKNIIYSDPKLAEYKLLDANGNKFIVYGRSNMLSVGDTIK
jgi:hypothetical protein